ncbi:MAG: GAF domain-containing sensor histidine kinase [Solirubrobacterales bacterium]|nr:GAF domain-containing sensor histidine kinase [Solirubrobacterales bacterium]
MADRDRSSGSGVLDVACGVLSDLDVDVVLERLLDAARDLTGAEYAAVGVLDPSRSELERFVTAGVDELTRQRIGALPHGRGVLGELIADPRPLRLADAGMHPHSYGFPAGHPPMKTFLGVPVRVAGQVFGNLYLTEKRDGKEFTAEDERALVRLAEFAGVAIDHARRYSEVETQRLELKRTVQALDATVQIARAIGGETDLEKILELVAKRGRALVSARGLVIEHERGGELVVAAGAGEVVPGLLGKSVDADDSLAGTAMRTSSTLRLEDEPNRARFDRHGLGRLGLHASAGLVVPLIFRGQRHGVLIAVDRLKDGPAFTADDQRLLEAFAASAATAIATARSVELERTSQRLAAAEQERARWARELHDETLQNLAALRIGLAVQLRKQSLDGLTAVVREAIVQLEGEISNLRSLITALRPIALDDAGVHAAIEDLAERARRDGLEVELRVALGDGRAGRHSTELETTLYRITQEALTNARKHGGAGHVLIEIRDYDDYVHLSVRDDGQGFDPCAKAAGFGLHIMGERAELLGGTLEIDAAPGRGTQITVDLPTHRVSSQRAS